MQILLIRYSYIKHILAMTYLMLPRSVSIGLPRATSISIGLPLSSSSHLQDTQYVSQFDDGPFSEASL